MDDFIPSPTEKKIVEDEEEAYFSLQSIWMEESPFEVNHSPAAPKVYEISNISSPHLADPEEEIWIYVIE